MEEVTTKVSQIETIINYTFTNKLLCVEALQMNRGPFDTPAPVRINGIPHAIETNTRLAVLGDAMMDAVLSERWFQARDEAGNPLSKEQWDEGLRKAILCNKALGAKGRPLGVGGTIIKNAGTVAVAPRMIATTIEAVVGAAYLDAGGSDLYVVRRIMERFGLFDHPLLAGPSHAAPSLP